MSIVAGEHLTFVEEKGEGDEMSMLAWAFRAVGGLVPTWLPHGSAVGNRLLKPMFIALGQAGPRQVELWSGIRLEVDPADAIGGNLFFCPQLYDRLERSWVVKHLPKSGTFVDVGANIGLFTAVAARQVGSNGKVLAIEADPDTFRILQRNAALNGFDAEVTLVNAGVAGEAGVLPFYRNVSGNRGANSFMKSDANEWALDVEVRPLYEHITAAGLRRIDLMKLDIEGYELQALASFFRACAEERPALLPEHIMLELEVGPLGKDPGYRSALLGCLTQAGYRPVVLGSNALFAKSSVQDAGS